MHPIDTDASSHFRYTPESTRYAECGDEEGLFPFRFSVCRPGTRLLLDRLRIRQWEWEWEWELGGLTISGGLEMQGAGEAGGKGEERRGEERRGGEMRDLRWGGLIDLLWIEAVGCSGDVIFLYHGNYFRCSSALSIYLSV